MTTQTWDPKSYSENARFVAELGQPLLEILAPQKGERILDLGCGDGFLTAKILAIGCEVVGIDSSREQVEGAIQLGIDAQVMDAENLEFDSEFDAVFSNATLHWMQNPDAAIDGVWRALKPQGRFVGECGGEGCVAAIRQALSVSLKKRGVDFNQVNPWYFASASEYKGRLEARGFTVPYIEVFPRPTPLPGEVRGWLQTFARSFMAALPEAMHEEFLQEVQQALRPVLCDAQGQWSADYTRLRFTALKNY